MTLPVLVLLVFLVPAISVYLISSLAQGIIDSTINQRMADLSRAAAALVDPEAHAKLQSAEDLEGKTYQELIEPLIQFHRTQPSVYYLFSLTLRDDLPYFVLDTATQSERLNSAFELEASGVMELYEDVLDPADAAMFATIAKGETYVYPEPYWDEFGTFIGACSPIPDQAGPTALCLDFDIRSYLSDSDQIKQARMISWLLALILSALSALALWRGQQSLANANDQLFRLASTDSLTGLNNRRQFFEVLDRQVASARRYQHPLSLLILDVDHFKSVNDRYGHATGDEALRTLGQIIRDTLRPSDEAGRIGGEEFAVILPQTDAAGASNAAERLRCAVQKARVADTKVELSVSVGYAQLSAEDDINSLSSRADKALYEAKEAGRNRVMGA